MDRPALSTTAVISDDAKLAAQLSCLLSRNETYLPILDGPRLARHDRDAEVVRRLNVTARARAQEIVLAGLSDEAVQSMSDRAGASRRSRLRIVRTWQEVGVLQRTPLPEVMTWGANRIGIGLLKALRRGSAIKFSDKPSPDEQIATLSGHLVVSEDGDDLAQVIAANYAYAFGAGLALIPSVEGDITQEILERFYSVQDDRSRAASDALEELRYEIRQRCNGLSFKGVKSLTFVGSGIPYGFAFPELPSTHLFQYPDLGNSIANGFATQQSRSRGVDIAVFVDPRTTEAPEMLAAEELLPGRGIFLRFYEGKNATVRNISEMVEMFPYDLLVFATHCGDVSGSRWTYEYDDSEKIRRTLIVDIAIGVADTDNPEMLNVTQHIRFVSLDGVDWNDTKEKEKLYVGTAITSFMERIKPGAPNKIEPIKKEPVERVIGSAALKMSDHNFLTLPRSIADEGTPIVINNACCSWHQLAKTFAFSGARAYIGTLFPILTSEAEAVTASLLGARFGDCLPDAVWAAQNDSFGSRRPYLMMGIYPQAIRVVWRDVPQYLKRRLTRRYAEMIQHAKINNAKDEKTKDRISQTLRFYQRELESIEHNWGKPR